MNKKNTPLFLLILAALSLTSCMDQRAIDQQLQLKKNLYNDRELDSTSQYYDRNYKVYTLEGCEYIVMGSGKSQWGSHKGNCKNPIHKENASN